MASDTTNTQIHQDVDKFVKRGTIEIDGEKHTEITDIIIHSFSFSSRTIMAIFLEVDVMDLLLYQDNDQKIQEHIFGYEKKAMLLVCLIEEAVQERRER